MTPLSIGLGHILDVVTNVLGEFSSVQATTATVCPTITLLDDDGKPTGQTHQAEFPDHYTIAGILKCGAVVNIFFRVGYAPKPGRRPFLWEIDGDEGTIKLEGNGRMGAAISAYDPEIFLNGEKVEFEDGPSGVLYSVPAAWKAFADGKEGGYATIDDAVKNHKLLAAIEKSGESGAIVKL